MSNKINRIGKRYGSLLVLKQDTIRGNRGQIKWLCRCDCGNTTSVLTDNLARGTTKSCGCLRFACIKDEQNRKYGSLSVIKRFSKKRLNDRQVQWECRCDCGKEIVVSGKRLRSGEVTACGYCSWQNIPIQVKGISSHPRHNIWYGMLSRCWNRDNPSFKYYGELGIGVYDAWRDPRLFLKWLDKNLGPRPEGYSLDRIDVFGNYEPGNLRWASAEEQVNNRRLVLLSEEEYAVVMEMRSRRNALASAA